MLQRIPFLREVMLLLASLLLSLALVEGLLRLLGPRDSDSKLSEVEDIATRPESGDEVSLGPMLRPSENERIVYQLRANLDVLFRPATLEHSISVKTNSAGWREEEIPVAKQEGTFRIVALGDSFLFGWGVEVEERFVDLLEAELRALFPTTKIEVIAMAVPGYNLAMEVEVLETFGLAYSPDLIIYNWIGNDACLPNFVVERSHESRSPLYLVDLVSRFGRLTSGESQRASFSAEIEGRNTLEICETDGSLPWPYRALAGPEAFDEALEKLDRIGRAHEIPVVITAPFRFPRQLSEKLRSMPEVSDHQAVAEIQEYVRQEGEPIPRNGVFGGGVSTRLILSSRDPHPSPEGHRVLADSLFQFLMRNGLLESLLASRDISHPEGQELEGAILPIRDPL